MTHPPAPPTTGPLVLGAGGRVGTAFRTLAAAGLWPGPRPLWHSRTGGADDLAWDIGVDPAPPDPRLTQVRGMIVLTGGTGGRDRQDSAALALAALDLAQRSGIGPVLLCSSQAVYGQATGPQIETAQAQPVSAYGQDKLAMEQAVAQAPGVCCLRIGNVAGCDMLLTNARRGPVRLDRFDDGTSPQRCYIGPLTLARVMLALIDHESDLPPVINVAAPGEVTMARLLQAAGIAWEWQPAPPTALRALSLDLALLQRVAPVPPGAGAPDTLIAEARAGGWSAA